MSEGTRLLVVAFGGGLGATVGIVGLVFLSGMTFGQRCERAYFGPEQIEACVERLSAGGPVYQTEEQQS